MNTHPGGPGPPPGDPQCPWMLQRIQELHAALAQESEPARRRHWHAQLRALNDRARRLGCPDADDIAAAIAAMR